MNDELNAIKQTFINESLDLLEAMERSLLKIENSPEDQETINTLFRSAHTIKGSSGMVGYYEIEKFTHTLENTLSSIRDGKLSINRDIIDLLLECKDYISDMIRVYAIEESVLTEEMRIKGDLLKVKLQNLKDEKKVLEKELKESSEIINIEGIWHISVKFNEDILTYGFDPLSFINYMQKIGEVRYIFVNAQKLPPLEELNHEKCYLSFEIGLYTELGKKAIEDIFEFVIEDVKLRILPPNSKVEEYIKLIEELKTDSEKLGEILVNAEVITKKELEDALEEQRNRKVLKGEEKKIGEIIVEEKMAHQPVVDVALEKQKKILESKQRESKTIKVDSEKLDHLINMVGELVIATAGLNQQSMKIGFKEFLESVSIMTRLVEDIREKAMQLRMVPVGETFSKFQRVVRDICKETGKEIELRITGGDTELDKNVTEKINDPLMHLIRNACDHGIETPDVREKIGKPRKGIVKINAYNDAGSIVIEIIDDGKGIDKEKILQKAISMGLIQDNQQLSEREIFNLIFHPGLSTAEDVTKFSGRGVGMDVVKKGIESLRGIIDIDSKKNIGTTVRIKLPLTLAIIDGFMVSVDDANFIIPLEMVIECLELNGFSREDTNQKKYIDLRGEVLPLIRLRDIFYNNGFLPPIENVVVVKVGQQKIGIVVDKLKGEVQTVIKNMGIFYKNYRHISGATILGDGNVALILDVQYLLNGGLVC